MSLKPSYYHYFIFFAVLQSVIATNFLLGTSALKNLTILGGEWSPFFHLMGGVTPKVSKGLDDSKAFCSVSGVRFFPARLKASV